MPAPIDVRHAIELPLRLPECSGREPPFILKADDHVEGDVID
jgi:hypothetical protein